MQRRLLVEDRNFWAPELHYLDGKWFIYYAAGTNFDPFDVRIRVIENDAADPMSGTWKDRGKLDTGRDTLSLDSTVLEQGGKRYLLWAQGPAVLKRNGRVFVSYSSNATDARYCIGLMEARDDANLLDPASWKKLPGPALDTDAAAGVYGPGHNSFTTSPDGTVDHVFYHARDYETVVGNAVLDHNRSTRVQAFTWDSNGRPVFGRPLSSSR